MGKRQLNLAVCILLGFLWLGRGEPATSATRDTLTVRGEDLGIEEAKVALVALLEAEDPALPKAALTVLRTDLGAVVDASGSLDDRIAQALDSCYRRLPGFPAGTEITSNNVVRIARSDKVFAFCTLATCGGDRGTAAVTEALNSQDPVMRQIARKIASGGVFSVGGQSTQDAADWSNLVSRLMGAPLSSLTNELSVAFSGDRPDQQRAVLAETRRRASELRRNENAPVRKCVISIIKAHLPSTKSPSVKEQIVTTVVALDDQSAAADYLNALIGDPKTTRHLRAHCQYVLTALQQGVFR